MMNSENNIRLLYELNAKDAQLDFAIRQAERQLNAVNKKIQMLRYDVVLSALFTVLPLGMYLLTSKVDAMFLASLRLGRILLLPVAAVGDALESIYRMLLPLLLLWLARSVRLWRMNREDAAEYAEPARLGTLQGEKPEREPSFRAEQKKLVCILSRYYLNKDKLGQLRRQITESDSCTMTLAELYYELSGLPFYEEVRPAQESGIKTGATGGGMTRMLWLLALIIGLIQVFHELGII